jgi:CRP-like cAMP-binding protein
MVAQVWMDETCLYGKAADLRRVPLFADLDDEAIVGVAAVSHGRVHTRGAWLVEACEARERLFVVARGNAWLHRLSWSGAEVTLAIKHVADVLDRHECDRQGSSKNDVEILADDTVIYGIPRVYLVDIGFAQPRFLLRMAELLADRVAEYQDIIVDLMTRKVEVRVAHGLVRLAGPRDAVELTRCQLATVVAASREEVGKALKDLRTLDLIAYEDNGRSFRLLDKIGLATLDDDADV